MKHKYILTAIVLFCCGLSYSQEICFEKGIAHHVNHYKNGQKSEEGYLRYGLKSGKWSEWYENGQKKSVKYYDLQGVAVGRWTSWYENGQRWNACIYKNGKIDGKWTYWYRNGNKWHELTYRDGEVAGKWTFWHQNGVINQRGKYDSIGNEG